MNKAILPRSYQTNKEFDMKKFIIALVFVMATTCIAQGVSRQTVAFIQHEEGFKSTPYYNRTHIGHGTSVQYAREYGYKRWTHMSRTTARHLLERRLQSDYYELHKVVNMSVLPTAVQTAVHSAYYHSPTLVGHYLQLYLKVGDMDKASKELAYGHRAAESDYAMAFIARRIREANLIRSEYGMPLLSTPTSITEFIHFRTLWYNRTNRL